MRFGVTQSIRDLESTGSLNWRATSDNPSFIYRFWLRRPRYMIVVVDGKDDASLNPRLYVDRGNGFEDLTSISLAYGSKSIYLITVLEPRQVKALRFDPCSNRARFAYWVDYAWTDADRDRLLSEAQHKIDGDAVLYKITLDGNRKKKTRRPLSKKVAEHYASVLQLAESMAPAVDASLTRTGPFISFVVPVYNTPVRYLDDLFDSFLKQPNGAAEIVLSDDGSTSAETINWLATHERLNQVQIIRRRNNRGVAFATNAGVEAAHGEWVGLVDHDDSLTPYTVQLIAETIKQNPSCQFIYTDELVTDENLKPLHYFMKPAYDEVLLSGVNYINHLSCYRRQRLLSIGGMRPGYEGSQDYDLVLRYLKDVSTDQIKHLPYPAYRWRRDGETFSARFLDRSIQSARKALGERYSAAGSAPMIDEALTKTLHRVRFDQQISVWPRVSIVIPSKESFPLISRILSDLLDRTNYPDYEIIVIDNGTTDPRVLDLYRDVANRRANFRVEIDVAPFNFSRQVNRGIDIASGDLVLLLNNDVEVVEPEWLREMVSCFEYPNTGIVGARLVFPNGRLQHAGVIVGLGGLAGHWFGGYDASFPGPMGRLHVRQSMTAVTGACMLVSRACLNAVGRFDEDGLGIAYNDIDFCLRAAAGGFRTVWTPFATLIHHESASRGSDEEPCNRARFQRDKDILQARHRTDEFEDRAYNPWLSRSGPGVPPVMRDRLPDAR